MSKSSRGIVQSMTGFSQTEGAVAGTRIRMEIKTLNHRFLDLKIRLPRELSSAEMPLRNALSAKFSRGAVDLKVERILDPTAAPTGAQVNLPLARHYHSELQRLAQSLGLNDEIRAETLLSLPEVLSRTQSELASEDAWKELEPVAQDALHRLAEMRAHEGQVLARTLEETLDELDGKILRLRERRKENEAVAKSRTREKITAIFEAYPLTGASAETVLESRIAQELAILVDRTDIEEELTRFKGHLDHFRKVLREGGPVGRKLDFILQELNREINTLGNKSQDLAISEETIAMKVRIEQLREQVMNLE